MNLRRRQTLGRFSARLGSELHGAFLRLLTLGGKKPAIPEIDVADLLASFDSLGDNWSASVIASTVAQSVLASASRAVLLKSLAIALELPLGGRRIRSSRQESAKKPEPGNAMLLLIGGVLGGSKTHFHHSMIVA